MTDPYADLHAEMARLRDDSQFQADVARVARQIGPAPAGPRVTDDGSYITHQQIDSYLAAGRIRDAAVLNEAKRLADSWPAQ